MDSSYNIADKIDRDIFKNFEDIRKLGNHIENDSLEMDHSSQKKNFLWNEEKLLDRERRQVDNYNPEIIFWIEKRKLKIHKSTTREVIDGESW